MNTMQNGVMAEGYHSPGLLWKDHFKAGLAEDGWVWDWTTLGLGAKASKIVEARVVAKAEGVWAGAGALAVVAEISQEMGLPVSVEGRVNQGFHLREGDVVCRWRGPARAVLALERPFLNLVSYVSGIATQTRRLVDGVNEAHRQASWKDRANAPRVTATRKTLPLYRDLALEGVLAGGGWSHRYNLAAGILVKENHIRAAGGIAAAIDGARRSAPHLLKIECEVRNLDECRQALQGGAEAIMLDNFSPTDAKAALKFISEFSAGRLEIPIEVSGGIHHGNIGQYVMEGVTLISSGSLTHSVQALDLSLLVDE